MPAWSKLPADVKLEPTDASLGACANPKQTDASLEQTDASLVGSHRDVDQADSDVKLRPSDASLEVIAIEKHASDSSQANLELPRAGPGCRKPGDENQHKAGAH